MENVKWEFIKLYHTVRAKLEYGILWKIGTAKVFLVLAWKVFSENYKIMQADVDESKGGFKYLVIAISKTPLSNDHSYPEFLSKRNL